MALLEFRIWERGHINMETLSGKLEAAISHALWDVVLEYRLLPFPLCCAAPSDNVNNSQSLPCSEPTTPVRRKCSAAQLVIFPQLIYTYCLLLHFYYYYFF